jgi:hypothetical protein
MADFNNSEKVDFLQLSELCLEICDDKQVKLGDWSQRDIDLFVSQFKEADLEPQIDMDKLDPHAYPRSYFEKKYPGFDDVVIDALYECENKKLEDTRLCPFRVLRDKVGTLSISNPTKEYNAVALQQDDKAEAQEAEEETAGKEDSAAEAEASPEATADSYSSDRFRWFKKANEEEEEDDS